MTGLEPARPAWKAGVPPTTLHMHADKRSACFLLSIQFFYRIAAEWTGVVTIHPVRIFSPSLIHLSYLSMAFSAIKKPHQEISSSLCGHLRFAIFRF